MRKQLRFFVSMLLLAVCGVTWGADTWVKTAPADLATGDIVVIVDQSSKRALNNSNGTSAAPAATAVTLSETDGEITSDVSSAIQWEVTVSNGSYEFKVPGTSNYLYCTATNNGVRVGTNANKAFTISNNGSADFLMNEATNRYLGVYNEQDWRCYTSINNNIKNCVTAFYKKSSGDTPSGLISAPTFSPAAGAVAYGTEVTLTQDDAVVILYTTDGTAPSYANNVGDLYREPFTITSDMTIKAIAVDEDGNESAVATATYTLVRPAAPEFNPAAGEVVAGTEVSITGEGDIYYTIDGNSPMGDYGMLYEEPIVINEETTVRAVVKDENGTYSDVAVAKYTIYDPAWIDLTYQGFSNAETVGLVNGGLGDVLFEQGTNSNPPKYYDSGTAVRLYVGNTVTFWPNEGYEIESIEFVVSSGDLTKQSFDVDGETTKSMFTPTSPASEIVMTVGANLRFQKIKMNIVKIDENPVPEPQFDTESGPLYREQDVEIFCDDENAAIYYTTDGTTPTTESTLYTEPIHVSESITIKAVAYVDGKASKVAVLTLTKVMTVAEANAALAENSNISGAYVKGVISQIDEVNLDHGNAQYWISDDGTTDGQLEIYRGLAFNGGSFTSEDQIALGDEVIVYGNLTVYKETNEFGQGSQIIWQHTPPKYYLVSGEANNVFTYKGNNTYELVMTLEKDATFYLSNDEGTKYMAMSSDYMLTEADNTVNLFVPMTSEADVAEVTMSAAGTWTFTWNTLEQKLTVEGEWPALPEFTLAGTFNEWNTTATPFEEAEDGTWTLTTTLDAYQQFKVVDKNGNWYGHVAENEYWITADNHTDIELQGDNAANFYINDAGEYTFIVNPQTMTLTVEGWPEAVYDLRGSFNNWGATAFVENEDGTLSVTQEFSGNVEFKITKTQGNNISWYGGETDPYYLNSEVNKNIPLTTNNGGNFKIEEAGTYTFTIDLEAMTFTVTGWPEVEKLYELRGSFNNWGGTAFVENEDGTLSVTQEFSGNVEFKITKTQGNNITWYGGNDNPYYIHSEWYENIPLTAGDNAGNFKIEEAGTYTFTIDPENMTLTVTGWEVAPEDVVITLPSSGYATYCNEFALDFSQTGAEVYYCPNGIENGAVQMVLVENGQVPGGAGVIVKGEPGAEVKPAYIDKADELTGNKLIGAVSEITLTANQGYVLKDGQFHPCEAGTLAAGKAYLGIPADTAAGAKAVRIIFGDEDFGTATAIRGMETNANATIYTLSGVRVEKAHKGIYIVGGKKVVK